jgi:hypothetical protein
MKKSQQKKYKSNKHQKNNLKRYKIKINLKPKIQNSN